MSLPRRVFIANRGEIAVRVMRTCRALGVDTVWPATAADSHSLAAREAGQIVALERPADYLAAGILVGLARDSQCDAVHPGYGYLSENAGFAAAVEEAGMLWIGPGQKALAVMGDKLASRQAMMAAGVPVVPGSEDLSDPLAALHKTGLPALLKPSAGGGGKGMVIVEREADFTAALASCRAQALKSFADDRVILERWVPVARHVEVQIMADSHGTIHACGTRDCSVQRRHQKVIEEAPAPNLPPGLAQRLEDTAREAARAVNYLGAGTVEFILTPDGEFFFLEMNTRLQVEHPVSEEIFALDLVAQQLRVAAGDPLPPLPHLQGHAMEVRLYAEDPDQGFLPCTGKVSCLRLPEGPGIRVDGGLIEGATVAMDFDPLLLKIIAHGADRDSARLRLIAALRDFVLHGVGHNGRFLLDVLQHEDFIQVRHHTRWLEAVSLGAFGAPEMAHWQMLAVARGSPAVTVEKDASQRPSAFIEGSPFRFSGGSR